VRVALKWGDSRISILIVAGTHFVLTILLVDDDELVRATLTAALGDRGYSVVEAGNGQEALALLDRSVAIDVIVLDIMMPEMEGIETLREIRKRWSMIPIVMISGGDRSGWTDALGMAEVLGANRALRKPFTPRQLIENIEAVHKETKRA
jgi:two-component system, OmpR family, response regulator ResD